ncbi:MAG: magnesium protoporphyrin IX methyltransferase [Sphingomonadaceae bacterium]
MLKQVQHDERPVSRSTYVNRRDRLENYFDGTAKKAWIDLTSEAPLSGIRATVRAGRERMRETLLDWLPDDLRRTRLLDAGCGTGALAVEAARRGARVVAVDVAEGLVDIARERAPSFLGHGEIDWHVGDMLDPALGRFDHVVGMDSLIHYPVADIVAVLDALGMRCGGSMLFTFAPRTPALAAMHGLGRLFPRGNRAPAIEPVSERALRKRLAALSEWRIARSARVASGFYTSQAIELVRR